MAQQSFICPGQLFGYNSAYYALAAISHYCPIPMSF